MELLYIADPMCSWCYGFTDVLARVKGALPGDARLRYVMGGLAPDSDDPMPEATRAMVQRAWDDVERATGARFNRAFWTKCEPRRSTYPACRAVIAAESVRPGSAPEMFAAIQRAYYRDARNPSDQSTLDELAEELGLDAAVFSGACRSAAVVEAFAADRQLMVQLGVSGYPTLGARTEQGAVPIAMGWTPWETVEPRLRALLH